MPRDIEVKLLRTLVAVADNNGFSRAALAQHMTQPTVSHQIHRLELIVRAPLFRRGKRPLQLTPVGRELVAHGRRIIALNSEALNRISAMRSQNSLSLGCSVHFAGGLPRMVREFAAERADLQYSMTTGASAVLADKLAAGELDAAILLAKETPRCESLGKLRLAWFGNAHHDPGTPIPMAMVSGRSGLSMHISDTLAAREARWRVVSTCADPLGVRALVQAGVAFTALPENADRLCGHLPPVSDAAALGPSPEPLPVFLAFAPTVREDVAETARVAARAVLSGASLESR